MRTIALEGRCFVISACQYLTRAERPADYAPIQGDAPEALLIRGGSCIIDPLGNILVEPDFAGEAVDFGVQLASSHCAGAEDAAVVQEEPASV